MRLALPLTDERYRPRSPGVNESQDAVEADG